MQFDQGADEPKDLNDLKFQEEAFNLPQWSVDRWGYLCWEELAKECAEHQSLWPNTLKNFEYNDGQIYYKRRPPGQGVGQTDRPNDGVSVIHIPGFAETTRKTAVHFSWSGDSCRIRNYVHPSPGLDPAGILQHFNTHEIEQLIQREKPVGRDWPPVTNTEAWHQILAKINAEWGIG